MKVILFIGNSRSAWSKDIKVFSNRAKLLKYLRTVHYETKSLRLKKLDNGVLQLLNHNTPIDWWDTEIQEVKLDNMEIR